MPMSGAVDAPGDHELVTIAAELERYWLEQWRRAKEICDLLERRLAGRTIAPRPQLRLVSPPPSVGADGADSPQHDRKLVDV
jgi:hypothetical protein